MRIQVVSLTLALSLAAGLAGCGSASDSQRVVTTQDTFVPNYGRGGVARDITGTRVDPATGIPLPGASQGNAGF